MRKTSFFFISLIALSVFIQSCKKDDSSTSDAIKDRSGNIYHAVQIGTQTWMVENLKTTKFRNGDQIPNVTDGSQWSSLTTAAYCQYNNDINNVSTYGRLYNWYAINDSRNIAPEGWHVATEQDWLTLIAYLGGENLSGGKLKETGSIHWNSPNTGATNETGFNALPGGMLFPSGAFYDLGDYGYWWSSSESSTTNAYGHLMFYNFSACGTRQYPKYEGLSVKCVKD